MNEQDVKLLNDNGWTVECESPFEISTKEGSFASGEAAYMVLHALEDENKPSPPYFVLRKSGCGTIVNGVHSSDIIGVTTDEEYAKSKNSVFCYYEPTILLDR